MTTITILNDNTPGRGFLSEHGLSFLIETDGHKILLDVGPGNVFVENAKRLNIDLSTVEYVVLSHGHWDHGNGLKYIASLPLIAHPEVFKKRFHANRNGSYVGLDLCQNEIEQNFELQLSNEPIKLCESVWFLGEIPRVNNFEAQKTAFVDDKGEPDFIPDDSGVVILTPNGLIVISGCAHAGIINTINHARNLTGEKNVLAVLGGFHLKKNDAHTKHVIKALKELQVSYVYPSHCTDLPALSQFFNAFGMNQIRTGDVLKFN